jgi:hypothetical protein
MPLSPMARNEAERLVERALDQTVQLQVCHYMIQPLVELYGGCMAVLKVS